MNKQSGLMKKPTMRLAAVLITLGVAGAYWLSPWYLLIPLFVALNMFQFSYTGWCLVDKIFKW